MLWLVGAVVSILLFIGAVYVSDRTWANDCWFYTIVMGVISWGGVLFLILFNYERIGWLEGKNTSNQ